MDIDEIMERLERGEVLMIDDQMRTYISLEDSDVPLRLRFVSRSILDTKEREALSKGETPQYEVSQHRSLAEALLALTDWKWSEPK